MIMIARYDHLFYQTDKGQEEKIADQNILMSIILNYHIIYYVILI